jgi:hypothetical protein
MKYTGPMTGSFIVGYHKEFSAAEWFRSRIYPGVYTYVEATKLDIDSLQGVFQEHEPLPKAVTYKEVGINTTPLWTQGTRPDVPDGPDVPDLYKIGLKMYNSWFSSDSFPGVYTYEEVCELELTEGIQGVFSSTVDLPKTEPYLAKGLTIEPLWTPATIPGFKGTGSLKLAKKPEKPEPKKFGSIMTVTAPVTIPNGPYTVTGVGVSYTQGIPPGYKLVKDTPKETPKTLKTFFGRKFR